jgi:hypothetical protein
MGQSKYDLLPSPQLPRRLRAAMRVKEKMTFHLGGGEGGIQHLLAQFKPAFEPWWATMPTPELS